MIQILYYVMVLIKTYLMACLSNRTELKEINTHKQTFHKPLDKTILILLICFYFIINLLYLI